MNEKCPTAEVHGPEYFRGLRVPVAAPGPAGEPAQQILPPKIRHYRGMRPNTAPPPAQLRVSRAEIETALHGLNNINPATEEVIDLIVLEVSRMDGFAENTPPFKEHQETVLRLLREICLYPID